MDDLRFDPADPGGTTGRPFHIASATVRPKPSARLFRVITVLAGMCSANPRITPGGSLSASQRET